MSAILVVDDDVKIARIIARYLEQAGYKTALAHDGASAEIMLSAQPFDLLVLDVLLPDTTGLKILHDLRKSGFRTADMDPVTRRATATAQDVPVLMLSALGMTDDIVGGLRSGADDYLVKPFEPRELVERIHALLRRKKNGRQPDIIKASDLELDLLARQASIGSDLLDLTRREYDLLAYLVCHPGRVFERIQLLDAVWGNDFEGSDRAVDLCILRLRGKLKHAGVRGVRIDTAWGSGYRLTILPALSEDN